MGSTEAAIEAHELRKRYGRARDADQTPALDGFTLTVPRGTVCGLLGPNGAGKTTAVRILATLLRFDAGHAEVAGFDVARQAAAVRHRIGFTGQYAAVDELLSGQENLEMFGRLYDLDGGGARRRAGELLRQFDLTEAAARPVRQYAGGMRRRLDLAASLIMSPTVLFLDEPTTGLDPHSRNEVWDAIRALVREGTTVLLTTQYLDEADHLADRIAVIAAAAGRGGTVIAAGTPDELKSRIGGDQIDVVLRDGVDLGKAADIVASTRGVAPEVDQDRRRLTAPVHDRVAALTQIARALEDGGIVADDIGVRRPTLDEAFLNLTRRPAGATEATPATTTPSGAGAHS